MQNLIGTKIAITNKGIAPIKTFEQTRVGRLLIRGKAEIVAHVKDRKMRSGYALEHNEKVILYNNQAVVARIV